MSTVYSIVHTYIYVGVVRGIPACSTSQFSTHYLHRRRITSKVGPRQRHDRDLDPAIMQLWLLGKATSIIIDDPEGSVNELS